MCGLRVPDLSDLPNLPPAFPTVGFELSPFIPSNIPGNQASNTTLVWDIPTDIPYYTLYYNRWLLNPLIGRPRYTAYTACSVLLKQYMILHTSIFEPLFIIDFFYTGV